MTDWEPEARPVAPELEADFPHATFPPKRTEWASVADQLDSATKETLRLWANGGTGNA